MADDRCEPMTTRDHLRLLWRRRWTLLGVLALCVGGAVAYVLLATPTWQARATVVVTSEQDARASVLSAATPLLSMLGEPVSALGGADRATQVQIIGSRPSLQAAHGLMRERPELLAALDPLGDAEALVERLPGVLAELGPQPPPARWPERYQALAETLYVGTVEDSDLIEVRCDAPDGELARDFVNALVLAYLGRSLADAQAATRRTRRYIEEEIERVEVRLAEAETSLQAFGEHAGTIVLDESARQQVALLVRLTEQAALAESTMTARRAMQDELTERLRGIDERIEQAITTMRNPEIVELQTALAEAEAERSGLLEEYAAESMPVRRATASVDELRARLAAASAEVVGSRQEAVNPVAQELMQELVVAQGEAMAARESLRVLRAAAARAEAGLSDLPSEQVGLLRVQREIELLERIYLALKERGQEYEIAERAKSPASRLIEPAITPDEPVRPKRVLSLAAGIATGLLLGLLAVGVAEHVDQRLHDPERAARALGVPVIATLRRGWQEDGAPEAVRAVVAQIRAAPQDEPAGVLIASVDDGAAQVAEALRETAADLPLTVAAGLQGLLDAMPADGRALVLCIDLRRTASSEARRMLALARERGMAVLGVVACGAARSGAAYYPATHMDARGV